MLVLKRMYREATLPMDTPLERAQEAYWEQYGKLETWHRQFPAATVSRTPYAQNIIWDMIFWAELIHIICGKSQAETAEFLRQLEELLDDSPSSPPNSAGSSGNLFFFLPQILLSFQLVGQITLIRIFFVPFSISQIFHQFCWRIADM